MGKQENTELTEEYKRLTKQFKDLQEKFHHFEQADEKKFREVWEMNEQEVRGHIAKVLEADRLLHEQQLGQELETFSESGTATGKRTAKESEDSQQAANGKYPASKVKKVLDLVKEETHFLLDMKVREQMVDLSTEQKDVLQIDAILRYIGVESQEDVDLLVSLFFEGQDEDDETLYIDADDVLNLLKKFIEEKANLAIADVAPDKKKKKTQRQ